MIWEFIFAGLGMATAAFVSKDATNSIGKIVKSKGIFGKKENEES